MKELIITSGILVFMTFVMGMQTDFDRLLHQGQELKFAADEAAATAGLCIDPESYGDGLIRFDRERAEGEAREMTALNLKGNADLAIRFREDEHPSVTVILRKGRLQVHSEYEYLELY